MLSWFTFVLDSVGLFIKESSESEEDTDGRRYHICDLILRTYRYEKPYQYRDFIKEDWTWRLNNLNLKMS